MEFIKKIITLSRFDRTILFKNIMRARYRNQVTKDKILQYWGGVPYDDGNMPINYLEYEPYKKLSELLMTLMKRYANPSMKILEIGCNAGRNLNYLYQAGYKDLEGIEIGSEAVKLMTQTYPEMSSSIKIYNTPVEDIISKLQDNYYNIVFTVAVLYHIHFDSDWIFRDIARITNNYIITIESEYAISDWRHFPRNYKKVFQNVGFKQIEAVDLSKITGLKKDYSSYRARVFKKE